jgi:hypothetical protein
LIKFLIKHKWLKPEHFDYAFEHRLQAIEARVAILFSWVNGKKFEQFEELVEKTHEMFGKDLDRQEKIEDIRATTLSQLDLREIREKIDLIMECFGWEICLHERDKHESV